MNENYPSYSQNKNAKEFLTIRQIEERIALLLEYGFPESAKRFRDTYKKILALKTQKRDDD